MSGKLLAGMLAEAFLRSALESMLVSKKMDAEGRTELNDEDRAALRKATDDAATAARAEGIDL